jgi:hypothetical protein
MKSPRQLVRGLSGAYPPRLITTASEGVVKGNEEFILLLAYYSTPSRASSAISFKKVSRIF